MNQIDANYNVSNKNDAQKQGKIQLVDEFVQSLSGMDSQLKQFFKDGLFNKLQSFASSLGNVNHNKGDYRNSIKLAEVLLEHLMGSHPDLVEDMIPDLKKLHLQNKKKSLLDYLAVSSQFILSLPNNESKLTAKSINTSFSAVGQSLQSSLNQSVFIKRNSNMVSMKTSDIEAFVDNDSLVSLTLTFSNEELMSLIRSMVENGLNTMDDLYTLLQLVGELGILACSNLMSSVADAVQTFIEGQASMISDPAELLRLVRLVREFSQGDLIKDINFDAIGSKLTDLITGVSDNSYQQSLAKDFQVSAINVSVDNIVDDSKYLQSEQEGGISVTAEQLAGAQFYKAESTRDKKTYRDHGKDSFRKISFNKDASSDVLSSNSLVDDTGLTMDDVDDVVLEACSSLLKSLDTLLERNQFVFSEQMLELMQAVYKHSLSSALDNFDSLEKSGF